MSPITTHVLDTAAGHPAANVGVRLERRNDDGSFVLLSRRRTDADGRVRDLLEPGTLEIGVYRITFETGEYLHASGREGFYPEIPVVFGIRSETEHYHVPLLLSPFGYSTYRGS